MNALKTKIEAAISTLTDNASKAERADDALKFSQAATNLANSLAAFSNVPTRSGERAATDGDGND